MNRPQPTRQPHPRRAQFRDPRDSSANSDIRDVVLVHINVQAPSPPGTLDAPVRERSLTPIPEVESDTDSVWIPRSGSPDSYAGIVHDDGRETLASGALWTVDNTGRGGRDELDSVLDAETDTRSSARRRGPVILTSSPTQVPSLLPEPAAQMQEAALGNHAGDDLIGLSVTAKPESIFVDRQAESTATSSQGVQPRLYVSLRQPPSRQSSSGSSILITHSASDGHQLARMVTYPIVASGGSQTIVPSQQFVRQSGAAVNANRRPPSQLMAHPNYSHYAIYHDMTTALGITIGTPFQTPRQQISPLPPQSADPVPVGGAYASTRSDPYLAPPAAPHFDDAAVPVHRHARNSSNCSSVTPVEQHIATPWDPKWDSFRLDVWRKDKHESIEVKPGWDDEDLVRELKKTYDRLRSWRRLLSLKGPRYITPVHWQGDESFIYPQRIGPARITAHRTLRTQYLLKHPERVRGKRELMLALTKRADVGIEFVEQWQVWRVAFLVFMLAFLSMVIAIVTSIKLNDWSTGFAIGGFFAQMFAVILVAIGFVHYEEL